MERILQSHQLGPHRVDVVESIDDDGQEYAMVVIDGAVVTDPPLTGVPSTDDVMRIYARWQLDHGERGPD
jgi:disulfide oxidoreductase YuzD